MEQTIQYYYLRDEAFVYAVIMVSPGHYAFYALDSPMGFN